MRQPVGDTSVTVVEGGSSTTSTGTSEGAGETDADACQDCIVTAGMLSAAASSLHDAPQARRTATQLVIRARSGAGNRRRRPRGSRAMSRRRSRSSWSFMDRELQHVRRWPSGRVSARRYA
jgi:hypothetical protein